MSGLWVFANVILPLVIVCMGYAAMRWDRHQSSE